VLITVVNVSPDEVDLDAGMFGLGSSDSLSDYSLMLLDVVSVCMWSGEVGAVCVCVQVTWVEPVTRVRRVRRVNWVNQAHEVTAASPATAATRAPPDARAASVHQARWAHPASRDSADRQDRPGMPDNRDRLDCRVRLEVGAALERRECRGRVVRWVSQGSRATLGSQGLAECPAVGVEQAPPVLLDSLETVVLQGNAVPSALPVRMSVDCMLYSFIIEYTHGCNTAHGYRYTVNT